mmetsp:Transcript_27359/g.50161  ORF Transcript_27359/g.50161 Transcript_27359/m.50161 type:complete len:251 (-) Transcript_27359:1156-1908(-)
MGIVPICTKARSNIAPMVAQICLHCMGLLSAAWRSPTNKLGCISSPAHITNGLAASCSKNSETTSRRSPPPSTPLSPSSTTRHSPNKVSSFHSQILDLAMVSKTLSRWKMISSSTRRPRCSSRKCSAPTRRASSGGALLLPPPSKPLRRKNVVASKPGCTAAEAATILRWGLCARACWIKSAKSASNLSSGNARLLVVGSYGYAATSRSQPRNAFAIVTPNAYMSAAGVGTPSCPDSSSGAAKPVVGTSH